MGISVAATAKNSGYTVHWASEGRSPQTRARAEKHGLTDAGTLADVEAKLAMANTLTRKRNYPAAVYYADRARRILNAGERRHEAQGQHLIVMVSRANVRKGPGASFDVIATLDYGSVILCLDKAEEWCRVRTDKGDEGWIHTTLLR